MKKLLSVAAFAVVMTFSGTAFAHYFWVNASPSFTHMPGHILMALGFGHQTPMDDLLVGDFGNIVVDHMKITGPEGKEFMLSTPVPKRMEQKGTPWKSTVEEGDLAIHKMAMSPGTPKGVYLVSAESKPFVMTKYVNKKGRTKMATKPIDQIKDVDKVLESFKYMGFAKSYVNYKGEWKSPQVLNAGLEITPTVDISSVKPGDIVSFETKFMGKKLQTDSNNIEYTTAFSDTYGMSDGFQLVSFVMDGKSQFRIPEAGNWIVSVYVKRDVDKTPELADLKGKVKVVYYGATLSFSVKP